MKPMFWGLFTTPNIKWILDIFPLYLFKLAQLEYDIANTDLSVISIFQMGS